MQTTQIKETLPTIIHVKEFYDDVSADKEAKQKLIEELAAKGYKCHGPVWMSTARSHHSKLAQLDGQTVELEQDNLFDNQWNTAPIEGVFPQGVRVFDFALYRSPNNRNRYQIQWLELDNRHTELRTSWKKCGYCGALEPAAKGHVFCPHCLGSPYLKSSDLHLLRMKYIAESFGNREQLTEAEREHLLPLYKEAQTKGVTERDKARLAKQREDLLTQRDKAIKKANTNYDGMVWLLDHGLKIDNVIYYDHTGKFSFGWREAVDAEVVADILEVISEFPFPYEIKCADGRKLESY